MVPSAKWFGKGLLACLKNDVDLEADTIKLTLHTSDYVPDLDADDFFDDATDELSTASGYTQGGLAVTAKTLTYDAQAGVVSFSFAVPTWTFTSTRSFRYGVLRKARGGLASADELLVVLDWGSTQSELGTFTVEVDPIELLAPGESWWPTVEDVAGLLRARTKPTDGQEYLGTFNASTRPTDTEVRVLIGQAAQRVTSAFSSGEVPAASWDAANEAALLRAAMWVETSYFPEQVEEGVGQILPSLRIEAADAMKVLVNAANVRALFSEAS